MLANFWWARRPPKRPCQLPTTLVGMSNGLLELLSCHDLQMFVCAGRLAKSLGFCFGNHLELVRTYKLYKKVASEGSDVFSQASASEQRRVTLS